ncbi:MAG TPA: hypothetical protein VJT81_19465 [Burkholderiales bacterium]|nr:hypothetical protein [Burkholderiales bacterium]
MSSVIEPVENRLRFQWHKGLIVLTALVGYQILLHWVISSDSGSGLGEFLTVVPLAVALIWFMGRSWRGWLGLSALMLASVGGWVAWRAAGANPALVYLLPHVGAYVFMLWLFGHTLMSGREALITRLARTVHGTLPQEVERYTRQVTTAWCLFFASMALTSLLLFFLAPLAIWSVFANLLSLPLVVAMFLAEYLYRILRYPNFSHASIRSTIQVFLKHGGSGQEPER